MFCTASIHPIQWWWSPAVECFPLNMYKSPQIETNANINLHSSDWTRFISFHHSCWSPNAKNTCKLNQSLQIAPRKHTEDTARWNIRNHRAHKHSCMHPIEATRTSGRTEKDGGKRTFGETLLPAYLLACTFAFSQNSGLPNRIAGVRSAHCYCQPHATSCKRCGASDTVPSQVQRSHTSLATSRCRVPWTWSCWRQDSFDESYIRLCPPCWWCCSWHFAIPPRRPWPNCEKIFSSRSHNVPYTR